MPCVPGERYSPEYPPPPATCSQFFECEYAKIPNTPEQSSIGFQTRLTDRATVTQMLSVPLPLPAYARTHADTVGTQERGSQSLKPSLALPIPDPSRPHFLVQEPQRCAPCSHAYSWCIHVGPTSPGRLILQAGLEHMFGSLPSETSRLLQPYSNAHGTSVVHQTLCKLPRIFFQLAPDWKR